MFANGGITTCSTYSEKNYAAVCGNTNSFQQKMDCVDYKLNSCPEVLALTGGEGEDYPGTAVRSNFIPNAAFAQTLCSSLCKSKYNMVYTGQYSNNSDDVGSCTCSFIGQQVSAGGIPNSSHELNYTRELVNSHDHSALTHTNRLK
jgi:hypothetical protein